MVIRGTRYQGKAGMKQGYTSLGVYSFCLLKLEKRPHEGAQGKRGKEACLLGDSVDVGQRRSWYQGGTGRGAPGQPVEAARGAGLPGWRCLAAAPAAPAWPLWLSSKP